MHWGRFDSASRAVYNILVQSASAIQPCRRGPKRLPTWNTAPRNILHWSPYSTRKPSFQQSTQPTREPRDALYEQGGGSRYIQLVDANGAFHPSLLLSEALQKIDKTTHQIVEVAPADPVHGRLPTFKVVPKSALRETERAREKKVDITDWDKHMEMHWGIDTADLSHRLKQMVDFLEDGRRVEVVIKPKKRGRKATPEESEAMFHKVKTAAEAVKGVSECKQMEGNIGVMVTLCFESLLKRSEKRKIMQELRQSSDKVLQKKKRLEDEEFEKKVIEKRKKFELKRLEKARREEEYANRARRSRGYRNNFEQPGQRHGDLDRNSRYPDHTKSRTFI